MSVREDAAPPQGPYGRLRCALCGTDRCSVTFTLLNLPADIVPTGALCADCVPDFESSAELRQVARLKVAYGSAPRAPDRRSAFHCPGCGMYVEEGHGAAIDGRLGNFALCHPCRAKAELTPHFRRDFRPRRSRRASAGHAAPVQGEGDHQAGHGGGLRSGVRRTARHHPGRRQCCGAAMTTEHPLVIAQDLAAVLSHPAYAGMRAVNQWIVWRLDPPTPPEQKRKKVPVDRSGHGASALDASNWSSAEQAVGDAQRLGPRHGVGFTFSPGCGFWFYDLDRCRQDTGWSLLARASVLQYFPGAAVEGLSPGSGLHLFGRGQPPRHRNRNDDERIEFYTGERYAAVTGLHAQGDCNTDHTAMLQWFVPTYFAPREACRRSARRGPLRRVVRAGGRQRAHRAASKAESQSRQPIRHGQAAGFVQRLVRRKRRCALPEFPRAKRATRMTAAERPTQWPVSLPTAQARMSRAANQSCARHPSTTKVGPR